MANSISVTGFDGDEMDEIDVRYTPVQSMLQSVPAEEVALLRALYAALGPGVEFLSGVRLHPTWGKVFERFYALAAWYRANGRVEP